ncbi:DsbA family oxidoreductase [Pseudomonas granadensis]|uniref:DsbA family oxidoreductase n=1 Tax=Pseudomonas granadensis TaxID=1421430 RepID=A0ABX7GA72_9PSED|nr:DsbA family oxidoreductase [Pseudomonas granadensis]MBN6776169.1 DsbA family oxidoreductase [Pseudomonas granadensis]MBN6807187.1 DsbA family oxidoreductase [Pseudomonas granadensis]MBN6833965.1 DsbA family oxidoreductase [Pseudomonas granadensis]MBN6841562.1 DsbA family oxidoreductase [Pseudomonas granadensis]MBN6870153.1 DsbA family oxidoreductase [Pseudomonas granadensis]
MSRTVKIDFVSDVVCPWCALGATALEQAISNLAGEVEVQLTYKPFELNPDMPAEGEHAIAHMMRKYGRSAEQVADRNAMIIERGTQIGFHFDLEKRSHFHNTFAAHRLLFWAATQGLQRPLKRALLEAYFSDGQNPNDHATLVTLAGAVGLDSQRAQAVLANGEFAEEVRELERFYQQRGIDSVPAMVIDDQQLIAGSQSVAYYEQALRQAAQVPAHA